MRDRDIPAEAAFLVPPATHTSTTYGMPGLAATAATANDASAAASATANATAAATAATAAAASGLWAGSVDGLGMDGFGDVLSHMPLARTEYPEDYELVGGVWDMIVC